MLSRVPLFATPGTVALQASLSTGFARQEYWGRLPFPSPGDLPDPEIEPVSPVTPALAGGIFTTEPPGKPISLLTFSEGVILHILSSINTSGDCL